MWTRTLASVAVVTTAAFATGPSSSLLPSSSPSPRPGSLVPPPPVFHVERPTDAVDAKLDAELPEVRFDGLPFDQAVDWLRGRTGLNLVVDWQGLSDAGVERTTPVTLHLRAVPAGDALEAMLFVTRRPTADAGYFVRGNCVYVGAGAAGVGPATVRAYDVDDIVRAEVARRRPEPGPPPAEQTGAGVYADDYSTVLEDLIRILIECVEPETWRDAGGPTGAIVEISGRLIVEQTRSGHQKVRAAVDLLRRVAAAPAGGPPLPPVQLDPPPGSAEARLNAVLPEVRFDKTPLADVIDALARRLGTNVVVDWTGAEFANTGPTRPIDLSLRDVTGGEALTAALFASNQNDGWPGWTPRGTVVYIGTQESSVAGRGLATRVYDVADLLRADRERRAAATRPAGAGGGGSASAATFDSSDDRAIEKLTESVTAVVDPPSWRDNGGPGSLKAFAGRLWVTQTRANHRRVEDLLAVLRRPGGSPATGPAAPAAATAPADAATRPAMPAEGGRR